ncbi:metallophosphoesterase family protein [Ralstonia nicotianae]|uniref:metallophosphoesterase family protein n=1 Tax=Ralstonia pseudosolanacearum TaxID=1310165 RepID=UPI0020058309|nr:metallophosphatase family protein [Ralstonia pseudosolanacearum]MCK4120429.1 metallophosphatase family protein [Ralstonia pseudosolanacearum]
MPDVGASLRVGHFSDLHYSTERLAEADRCLGFAVNDAIHSDCQVGVISGDATDHRLDAHTPALCALAERVHQLSGHMPVLMLQGTFLHEPPGTLDIFRLIGSPFPVYVADRIHQVALLRGAFFPSAGAIFTQAELDQLLADGKIDAVFTCIPTVNKGVLAGVVGTLEAATALGDHLAAYLHGVGRVNRWLRGQGVRTIGVAHGTVNGCLTEHGVPMAGFDHEFTLGALFDAECDAFMLGHIHRTQQWERNGRVVAYAGSIGCFHYGEEGKKSYLRWEVAPGQARATPIETPARETICVDFDGPPDMDRLAPIADQAKDKFVRVRWTIDEEHRQLVDREAIRTLFASAAELKLDPRVLPAVRSRAEGISRAVTLGEKVTRWCELTGTQAAPLIERLGILVALEPQDIADRWLTPLETGADRPAVGGLTEAPAAAPDDPPPCVEQEPSRAQWLSDDSCAADTA